MRNLSVEWFYGVEEKDRPDVEAAIRNSAVLLRQLNLIVERWDTEINSQEVKISDYDTPSWAARQAHRNGEKSRIRKLRDLISFIKER